MILSSITQEDIQAGVNVALMHVSRSFKVYTMVIRRVDIWPMALNCVIERLFSMKMIPMPKLRQQIH